jgi:CubicO group peptidase (beta-lactamase class C family)
MASRARFIAWLLWLVLGFGGARSVLSAEPRTQLLATDLIKGQVRDFVAMKAFTPAAGAGAPLQQFSGRLVLGRPLSRAFQVRKNEPFNIIIDRAIQSLPPFDFAFLQDGDTVIPVQRGPVRSAHPSWEFVLEPGRAWSEPGDGGYTRVAIPFALQERNANCLHNGVLSFVFRGAGMISRVYYEIASETCAYFKFDSWGLVSASFAPALPARATDLAASYRAEVSARLPVRPLSELIARHPQLSAAGLALATPKDGDPATLHGVVVNGVNYAGGCETRMGDYPYCDVLDLPSYSTAKTLVAAIGLMRLELLSPGARRALISDYVPECAARDWHGVSFENALDMATGVYREAGYEVDEDADEVIPFYNYETHRQRIDFACRHYQRQAAPGTRWVYRTTDTYVLGTAMAEYARRHLQQADFYTELLVKPLWTPLRLSPVLALTRRTRDHRRQPFVGYGLSYHRDDIARLANFLNVDNGVIDGAPMLDRDLLQAALQRNPEQRGMSAGFPGYVYRGGVWARDISALIGCAHPVWVPFMSGYGGISVVMFPGGIEYYYFGDSGNWNWGPAAVELDKLQLFCQRDGAN